jgi:RNA polymerase-binding transcription factor DksA
MSTELLAKKDELTLKREELLNRLDAIKQDYRNGLSADSEEQAIQLENAEVLEEISRVTNEELQKVTQALERIEHELKQS